MKEKFDVQPWEEIDEEFKSRVRSALIRQQREFVAYAKNEIRDGNVHVAVRMVKFAKASASAQAKLGLITDYEEMSEEEVESVVKQMFGVYQEESEDGDNE